MFENQVEIRYNIIIRYIYDILRRLRGYCLGNVWIYWNEKYVLLREWNKILRGLVEDSIFARFGE